ncbi:MAG: hypothetical protein EXQ88_03160 [Alphaproteobacteria bacterium]|nr:hypothetical protein [Alphaproteobacteria bacterium]
MLVHSLAEALAAGEAATIAGRPVRIVSAPAAASSAGPGWFAAVIERVRDRHPRSVAESVLDCGLSAGAALAAIRHGGIESLVVRVRPMVRKKLAAIGAARKISVLARPPSPALDLLDATDPAAACRAWLEKHKARP